MFSSGSEFTFVPFHWAHPYNMELREFDRKPFDEVPGYNDMLKVYAQQPHAYTGLYGGEMVCCFGAVEIVPGVAEMWLLTSHHVERIPISLTRSAIRYHNHIAIEMQLHRLQMTVEVENLFAVRWASALKFTREGRLRKYGATGQDYFMYARLF